MKKIIILAALLAGLAGCSSDSTTATSGTGTVTSAQLVGTWNTACIVDGINSFTASVNLTTTTGTITGTVYSDTACSAVSQMFNETFSYTLGADVTVDGSVAGITTGTELNSTDTTVGSSDLGTVEYSVISLVGNQFYTGDTEADAAKDGTAANKRPTKLDSGPFTKQ